MDKYIPPEKRTEAQIRADLNESLPGGMKSILTDAKTHFGQTE